MSGKMTNKMPDKMPDKMLITQLKTRCSILQLKFKTSTAHGRTAARCGGLFRV